MSFRDKIAQKLSTVKSVSYEKTNETIGPPKNLVGIAVNKGEDAQLTWEKPDEDFRVFGYEIFLDGSKIDTSNGTSFLYQGLTFGDVHEFKVRAVAALGEVTTFTNTVSLTGGGLPELSPVLYEERQGVSVMWENISDNQYYSIEGYNVYRGVGSPPGTKINSSLLGTEFNTFGYLNMGNSEDIVIGVSFEYDGGTESSIFEVSGTTLSGPTPSYYAEINGEQYRSRPLVGIGYPATMFGDHKAGIGVLSGTEVIIRPKVFNLDSMQETHKWSSLDEWDYDLGINPNNSGQLSRLHFDEGCGQPDSGLSPTRRNRPEFRGILKNGVGNSRGVVAVFYRVQDAFTVTGPACSGVKNYSHFSVTIRVVNPETQVTNEGVYDDKDDPGFKLIKKSALTNRFEAVENGSEVDLSWGLYTCSPHQKVYIKSSGGSYGTPDYELDDHDGELTIDNLTVGDYVAKLEYYAQDKTTRFVLTASEEPLEVSFSIT